MPPASRRTASVTKCRDRTSRSWPLASGTGQDGQRLLNVQFAGAAVIPQPVSDVRVLLDFAQHNPSADGVHGMRRSEVGLSGLHREPIHKLLDFSAGAGLRQSFAADWLPESQRDPRTRFGLEDVPHFGFAARHTFAVIRMHLDREPFGSEQQLHQQREFAVRQVPHLAYGFCGIGEKRGKPFFAPHLLAKRRCEADGIRHAWWQFAR